MTIDQDWADDLAGDYAAAKEVFDVIADSETGDSKQFEALFAQILADIRFMRLCTAEDERVPHSAN